MTELHHLWLELHRVHGNDQATNIYSSLTSANNRLIFAHHHLQLVKKFSLDAVREGLQNCGLMEQTDQNDDIDQKFSASMHQLQMHITDCAHHMHAIGDTLAFAIYYLTRLDTKENPQTKKKQLDKRYVTSSKVRNLLPPESTYSNQLHAIESHLDFVYLADLNNYAKHRSIVKPAVALNCDTQEQEELLRQLLVFPLVEMSNPPLSMRNRGAIPCHSQRSILPFLDSELHRLSNAIGTVLKTISQDLQTAPSREGYGASHQHAAS